MKSGNSAEDSGEPFIVRGAHVLCKAVSADTVQTVENGAILVQEGRIAAVDSYDTLSAAHPGLKVMGGLENIVMPGMVNGHHHVGMTPVQLGTEDLPLEQWLTAQWRSRDVDPYCDTMVSGFELIASGVTAVQHLDSMLPAPVSDWKKRSREVVRAYLDLGLRVSYALCVRDQHRLVYAPDETFLKTLPAQLGEEVGKRLAKTHFPLEAYETDFIQPLLGEFAESIRNRLIRLWLAPINLERASDRLLSLNKEWAARYGMGIHLHMSETIYQKMFSERRFGMSSVKHLQRINFLGPEVTLGHSVWTDDEDLDIIAQSGCAICHNASSNLRLRSGIAPLRSMLERNIPISMGIDEAGLNDDRDMLQELRVVKHLHAVPGIFARRLTSAQIFRMATQGGAAATGFGDEIGRIEVGRRADLVLIDFRRLSEPYLDPAISVVDALIYRARSADVTCVLIDGRIVYQDARFSRVDRTQIMEKLRADLSQPLQAHELERKRLSVALFPYIRDFYKDWPVTPERSPQLRG